MRACFDVLGQKTGGEGAQEIMELIFLVTTYANSGLMIIQYQRSATIDSTVYTLVLLTS